jgi:nucleoid-associated protein YgaU
MCLTGVLLTAKEEAMADSNWPDSATAILDLHGRGGSRRTHRGRDEFDSTDRLYIVTENDSLSSIARKFYGTASARSESSKRIGV